MDSRTLRAKEKYEGKIFYTKDGIHQFKVNQFNSGADIEIEYLDSGLIRHVSSYDIGKGISYPFPGNSIVYFDDSEKELMGNYYRTNEGYLVRVVNVESKKNVTVQFQDEHGYQFTTTIQNIQKGEVKNPYHRNKFGGYLGEGPFSNKKEYVVAYRIWYNMLIRTNDHEYYVSHHGNYTESYNNTIMDPSWLCFNTFAYWYITEVSKLNPKYSYEMDKDLYYRFYSGLTNGKKCYSPFTVALMPHDLNNKIQHFSGFNYYSGKKIKITKNNRGIIDATEFYYKENAITDQTYKTIIDSFELV